MPAFRLTCCLLDERVGRSSERHDYGIAIDREFRTGNFDRRSSSGSIGLAELHADALAACNPAVFISEDLNGVGEQIKYDAFFFGVMDFFGTCGKFSFRTAVNNVDFSAETLCGAGRIHGNIAAAYDDCLFCTHYGRARILGESSHQVGSGQIFVG